MPAVSSSLEKIPQNAPMSLALRPETIRHPDKRSKLENDATCGLVTSVRSTIDGQIGAGDVGRLWTGDKGHQSGDHLGLRRSVLVAYGHCHISCEVVGDPSDLMTTQRAAISKPLGLQLTRQTEAVMGRISEK